MANSLSISAELTQLRLRGLLGLFMQASRQYGLPLELLLAVASRESRMGIALDSQGKGDGGNAWGLMQIDKRWHPEFTNSHSPFNHEANISYASQLLASLRQNFGGNLKKAVASYNAGASKVRKAVNSGLDPDVVTTDHNYASDVLNRMELVKSLMGLTQPMSVAVVGVPIGLISLGIYNYMTTE